MLIPTVSRSSARKGFTLIEVVLSLGVIAFALVAILGVFPAGFASNRVSISDTRAAHLINAVTATIDAQCASFSNIDCYGETLDLSALTVGAPPKTLYVSYPSPNQPTISKSAVADWVLSVEINFDNDPPITSSGAKLGAGKINKVQLRVRGRSASEGFVEAFYLARKKG